MSNIYVLLVKKSVIWFYFSKNHIKGRALNDHQNNEKINQVYLGNTLKSFWLVLVKVQRVCGANKPQRWLKKCMYWTLLTRIIDFFQQYWLKILVKVLKELSLQGKAPTKTNEQLFIFRNPVDSNCIVQFRFQLY